MPARSAALMWSRAMVLALLGLIAGVNSARCADVGASEQSADALTLEARARFAERDYARAKDNFSLAVQLLERQLGPTNVALVEPLAGLADTLVAMQQRRAAIESLTRAVAILRRSEGLYGARQHALLRQLVDLYSSHGDLDAAASNLYYMRRVSENAHGRQSAQHARALTEIADWECRIGQFTEAREHYRESIDLLGGLEDVNPLVEALLGLARCSLEELSAEGIATTPDSLERYRGPVSRTGRLSPDSPAFHLHVRRLLRSEGERALQRAVQLADTTPVDMERRVSVLLQAGDWFQIKDHSRTARKYYAEAQLLAKRHGTGPEHPLAAPVQVLYPVPPLALRALAASDSQAIERVIELELTVRADGRVTGERIIEREIGKSAADETVSALRAARFRPRVVNGRAVVTEGVRFRQVFREIK